jgi:hypothetical protein
MRKTSTPASTRKDVMNQALPALLQALEPLQDDIARRCRTLPGAFIELLSSMIAAFEPDFSFAPFIQGLLVATASLSKKRLLVFLRGAQSKPFSRYMAHWHTCIAERNNAKTFVEDLTGVPMITEVMDFFKSSRSRTMRSLASHLCSLEDGSSKNITNDSSSALVYKLAAANERLNTWTLTSDEADTIISRLEDQSSMSEARFFTTGWDAGRRLDKNDSVTVCVTKHWQFIMYLILQPALKIREIAFEQEVKPLGIALRAVASTYRKPSQKWESEQDFDAAENYRAFTSKKSKVLSPFRENVWTLCAAVVVVNGIFPQSAIDAHPAGVRTSNTPASARLAARHYEAVEEPAEDWLLEQLEDDAPPPPPNRRRRGDGAGGSADPYDVLQALGAGDSEESLPPDEPRPEKEPIPALSEMLGDEDIEPSYVASDMQQRLDRQARQWEDESSRLYPSDETAHKKLGQLLAKYDQISTGTSARGSVATSRDLYRRGIAGKCKENLLAMSNAWEILDQAALLIQDACRRFGSDEFYSKDRTTRVALLIKTRKEQQGVEDLYFYDQAFGGLATILFENPVACAAEMLDMSMLTNLTSFDAVYPEEALADRRNQDLQAAAGAAGLPPGDPANEISPPAITPPLRPPLSAELKSDVTKVLKSDGFCVFNKELNNAQRADAAFAYLHAHGLGIYLKNVVMYTVNKNATLWSSAFLIKVAGTAGHIFLKLPHGYLTDVVMSARLVQAQIPLTTTIADPRTPIGMDVGRNTLSKMASYARWLLTALELKGKMSSLDAGSLDKSPELLTIAQLLLEFSDEAKLLGKESPALLSAVKTFQAPAEEPSTKSSIDLLHNKLFNLFMTEMMPVSLDYIAPP